MSVCETAKSSLFQPSSLMQLSVQALRPRTVSRAIQMEHKGNYVLSEDIKDLINRWGPENDDMAWFDYLCHGTEQSDRTEYCSALFDDAYDGGDEKSIQKLAYGSTEYIIRMIHLSGHCDNFMILRYRPPCCTVREKERTYTYGRQLKAK